MTYKKTSFQNLRDLFPDVESPVTCNDIYNRILPIRDLICDALEEGGDSVYAAVFDGQKYLGADSQQLFELDRHLRELVADTALALFLGVEASQNPSETLKDCTPEIKNHIVLTSNLFHHWFVKKASRQTKGILDRGNLAVTWIYLFAEFRRDLKHYNQDRWVQSLQELFVVEYS